MGHGKTRVAVLGAGPAGLAAAWELTATAERRERYEVRVYVPGWQAGGQCSSGRLGPERRVEQNGTHYLFGFYANALGMMRGAFEELRAAGVTEFGTFEGNLIPRSTVVLQEFFKGAWHPWAVQLPRNLLRPGDPETRDPGVAEYTAEALQVALEALAGWRGLALLQAAWMPPPPEPLLLRLAHALGRGLDAAVDLTLGGLLRLAVDLWKKLVPGAVDRALASLAATVLEAFRAALHALVKPLAEEDLEARRRFALADLASTAAIGFVRDGVLWDGLDGIDHWDFRAWFVHHGLDAISAWSPLMVTPYDAIAAYEDGDTRRPSMSAAAAFTLYLRMALLYRGAAAYQLTWEIGDSFMAPLFVALRARGVRFHFFHRVWEVVPDAAGERVESVRVERQARVKAGDDAYDPFIVQKGRRAWPAAPDYDQLVDPVREPRDFYRSFFSPAVGEMIELRAGRDFDVAVHAMPLAAAPYYCKALIAQKPDRWGAAVEHLRTVETQSFRLWMHPSLPALGWAFGPAITSSYANPLNTWENPSEAIASESWPEGATPATCATLFGPLLRDPSTPEPGDPSYAAAQAGQARRAADTWLALSGGTLWPGAVDPRSPPAIDPKLVAGELVLANCGPVEAYNGSFPGSHRYRFKPDETGYANLLAAGAWLRNALNVGSVEGAVLSGFEAARCLMARST